MKAMESFISFEPPSFYMAKDSELVREVEDFLKENKVQEYLVKYDRGIEYTEHKAHPKFEIEIKKSNVLKNLAENLNKKLTTDRYRRHHYLDIEGESYDIYVFNVIHNPKPRLKGYY